MKTEEQIKKQLGKLKYSIQMLGGIKGAELRVDNYKLISNILNWVLRDDFSPIISSYPNQIVINEEPE